MSGGGREVGRTFFPEPTLFFGAVISSLLLLWLRWHMCYCYQSHICDSATSMATQLLCRRTYLLHLSALSSLRNLCRSRHRLKQTTGPLYLDQSSSDNLVKSAKFDFFSRYMGCVCEVGWWIYVSIDPRPLPLLPGPSREDREGQQLTRISDGERLKS